MKQVTFSVEETLARVRRYAVGRGSSVDAPVREYLNRLADQQDLAHNARKRLRELSRNALRPR